MREIRKILLLAVIFGLLLFSYLNKAEAATCTASTTGNWNTTGTWSCGHVPLSTDDVVITSAVATTINVDTSAVANSVTVANTAVAGTLNVILAVDGNSLTISSGGGLTITGAAAGTRNAQVTITTGVLTIPGSVSFNNTRAQFISIGASTTNIGGDFGAGGTLTTSGTGTLNFNGSITQVIGAYTTYNNIQINNSSGGVLVSGVATTTFGGTLLVNAGTLSVDGFNFTTTGATTINSILAITSTAGTKTFDGLTIANGGVMNFTAAEAIAETGDLAVNGTGAITGTTGLWTFSKVGGGTISGTTTGTQTFGSATFNTNYSSSIPLTVTGTTTVSAGITFTNNTTFTATGALSGATGTFTQGASSILNIADGNTIGTLNASVSTNEVHYTSTTIAQTIHTSTYHHLFIDKSGQTGTLGGVITVNGNLTITAGNLSDGGFQITGNATGSFTLPALSTLTLGTTATATSFPTAFVTGNISLVTTSTVNYNSNSAQTISNVQGYGNLTLTATSAVTKTASGNLTINGLLTNGANNNFADGGFIITLKDGIVMTGTYTGTGKILFTGGSAIHTISGAGSYNNVELDDVNGLIQSGTTNIGGTLTITSGSWSPDGVTLTVTGDTSISGAISFPSTGGTKTFGNILINSGGSMNFSAAEAVSVNGNLTVNGTGVITGATGIWTFQKVGGGTIGGTASSLSITGATTFATTYSLPTTFSVNTFTVNTGVNETNTGTITINNALAGAGTFTQALGAVLYLGDGVTITNLDASAIPNDVHYISTTAGQTIKTATYYNLFIDKAGQLGQFTAGSTNVLGKLTLSAGTLDIKTSTLTVSGATDIHGSFKDTNNTGSTSFGGLVTVNALGSWDNLASENAPFNFSNGLVFNGTAFVSSPGLFTFLNNNQSITGSSAVTIDNIVVTGIQLTNSSTSSVSATASLSGTGEFIQNTNAILNIGGTSIITTLTAGASGNTVNYNGSLPQTVYAGTYRTLNVSGNTSGSVDITGDTTANTSLGLGATIFSTSSNKVIMGAGATLSRTTGFINGNLQKNIPLGSHPQTFEVGSGTDYTPINLNFNAVTIAGNLSANTTPSDHTSITTSDFFTDKTVNRFYTLVNSGVIFNSYNATFTFVPTDVDIDADTTNFVLEKFDSGVWLRPILGTLTPTSVSAEGLTSFSDFQIGEAPVITPLSALGSGGRGSYFPRIETPNSTPLSIPLSFPNFPNAGQLSLGLGALLPPSVFKLPTERSPLFDVISEPVGQARKSVVPLIIFSTIVGILVILLLIKIYKKMRKTKEYIVPLVILLALGCSTKSFAETSPSVLYVPLIGITSVPEPLALPKGPGNVTYKYAVKNFLRELALTDVKVTDDKCSPVKFLEGDDNNDGKLDYSETWRYTCTIKISETTQSIATAIGVANNLPAAHKAYATVVVGSDNVAPLVNIINITKVAYPLTLPTEGGDITFTYRVNNPGTVPLSDVSVTDDKCSSMSSKLGDTNGNNLLDINEVWVYTCTTHLTQTTTNTVSVTSYANGLKAVGYATLTVTVDSPNINSTPNLPETGTNPNMKIVVWTILSVILAALMILFFLRRNKKNE